MQLTISDVRLSFRQYLWLSLRFTIQTKPLFLAPLLAMVLNWLLLILLLTADEPLGDQWQNASTGIVVPLIMTGLSVLMVWSIWQQYQRSDFLQEPVTYLLDDDGVRVTAPSFRTSLDWAAVVKLQHFGHWLLLQTSAQTAFFLDLRRVQSPATAADVLDFFRQPS